MICLGIMPERAMNIDKVQALVLGTTLGGLMESGLSIKLCSVWQKRLIFSKNGTLHGRIDS